VLFCEQIILHAVTLLTTEKIYLWSQFLSPLVTSDIIAVICLVSRATSKGAWLPTHTESSLKRGLAEPAKNKKGRSAIKGWAEIQKRLCGNINHKKHARGHSRKLCQSATHQYNGGLWKEGDRKRMVDTVLVPTASWLTTSSRCFFKMGCCLWLAGDRPEKCLEITTNKKHLWRTVPSHPSSVVQSMYLVPVENGRNYSSEDPSELSLWPRRNTGSTCVVSMRDFRVQLLAQAQEKKYPFPESYEGLRY